MDWNNIYQKFLKKWFLRREINLFEFFILSQKNSGEIKYGNSRCCDFILSICYKCLWDWRDFDISRKINITTLYYSSLLRFHPYVYIHCRSSVISCLLLSSQTSQKFAIFVFMTHSILNIKEQYEVILINGIVYDIICEF